MSAYTSKCKEIGCLCATCQYKDRTDIEDCIGSDCCNCLADNEPLDYYEDEKHGGVSKCVAYKESEER